jgi:uncharacterized protein (TIGR01777 family)
MKTLVSGSHGLVGSALVRALESDGQEVFCLVRHKPRPAAREIEWDPDRGTITVAALEGLDAVVHLAGESIATGRWTDEKKQRIRDSRVRGTKLLSESLANLNSPPKTFVCASAIGYYGDRGNLILDEGTAPGSDFLSSVCAEWEQACEAAAAKGIRVINIRIGVVLSAGGGALAKMLTPFRMGVGGRVGSGKQWMSWIALDDVIGGIKFVLSTESLSGPVNFVAPQPVTNAEFTKTLGKVLSRPTLFPIPAFGVRLAFGEMADALLLSGQRINPARLKQAGYKFEYAELESTLRHALLESSKVAGQ